MKTRVMRKMSRGEGRAHFFSAAADEWEPSDRVYRLTGNAPPGAAGPGAASGPPGQVPPPPPETRPLGYEALVVAMQKAMLVWTGASLAVRRFITWRRNPTVEAPLVEVSQEVSAP